MKKASFILSIILHFFILIVQFDYNPPIFEVNEKNILEENIIKLTFKNLKNKQIIEQNDVNNEVDLSAELISNENNKVVEKNNTKLKINDKVILNDKENVNLESNDKISDLENNRENKASSLKFQYFEYYKEMKIVVDQKWNEIISERNIKIIDPEVETFLLLKINSKGEVLQKRIEKSSGFINVDLIALEAFNYIQLPIPPSELMNNKEFLFVQWGFSLKDSNDSK